MEVIHGDLFPSDPFEAIFADLSSRIANGVPATEICGQHPIMSALDDQTAFDRAPLLSQQIARIVHDIRADHGKTTFTHYALMHWYWSLWRWMLDPRPETYEAIPAHARPTPYQLFVPHPRVFDMLAAPNLRDLMCRQENPDVRWLSEGAATIECEWDHDLSAALSGNEETNELEFSVLAQVSRVYLKYGRTNLADYVFRIISRRRVFGPSRHRCGCFFRMLMCISRSGVVLDRL
jgi:hypothetical protein